MKVYILYEHDGESSYVVHVYSNFAMANQAKLLKIAEHNIIYDYFIEEEEVIE